MSTADVSVTLATEPDPFRYGWRYALRPGPDGQMVEERIPLTLKDLLHPQEGDVIPKSTRHERLRRYFQSVAEQRLSKQPNILSMSGCLVDWGHPEIRPHSPDIALLERENPWAWRGWGIIRLAEEEAHPLLVIEIASPSTRGIDRVSKPVHYFQVGVPLYVLVDQKGENGPLQVFGYRRDGYGYEEVPLDAQQRLLLPPLGVYLQVVADRVAMFDAATGKELGDYVAVCEALEKEVKARQEAERLLAEAERQRAAAEQQRAAAEQQRAEAERLRQHEEQARLAAEQQLSEVEQQRQSEQQARLTVEQQLSAVNDRVRALEEQLRRLQNQPPA